MVPTPTTWSFTSSTAAPRIPLCASRTASRTASPHGFAGPDEGIRPSDASSPALCATAGSLILSALVTAPAGAAAPTPQPAPETAGTTIAALRAADAGIRWGACPEVEGLPDSVRCGTVTVPLDYAHPMGKKIKLTVSRVKATGKNTTGKNKGRKVARQGRSSSTPAAPAATACTSRWPERSRSGGPSPPRTTWSDTPRAAWAGRRRCPARTRRRAGRPDAVADPPSAAYKKKRVAQAKAYARGCAGRNPDIEHFNTLNNARDLDVLRAALGEKKLTFIGASYGTYLGAVYAELFPSHVRRMVFDSAVDPSPTGSGTPTTSNSRPPSSAAGPTSRRGSPATTRRTTWAGRPGRCRPRTRR